MTGRQSSSSSEPPAEVDRSVPVEIRSPLDGSTQRGMLRLPPFIGTEPIPLVFAPHPFAWTVAEDYAGGYEGLRAASHLGWSGAAATLGVAILQADGHHRSVANCSLGYAGVVSDVATWIEAVGRTVPIDRDRIYAGGLSMGALEAVLMLGTHPTVFAAGFALNPVFDVAAWYDDLATTSSATLRAERNDVLIAEEVGGTPLDAPNDYDRRSVFSVVDGLRRLPLSISWSDDDLVVPRQRTRHGGRLHDLIRDLDPHAPVVQQIQAPPGRPLTDEDRWAIHESADYLAATTWLLRHRRRARAR